jgi:hypothetical protein
MHNSDPIGLEKERRGLKDGEEPTGEESGIGPEEEP